MFKKILIVFSIILISVICGFLVDHYLFPRLASTKIFSKYDFFKKTAERTTVINKTEQIYIKEDSSIDDITDQAVSSVVNIVSYDKTEKNPIFKNLTGEIVTSDGIIMTYASSGDMPDNYKVILKDGNVYEGKLLTIDSWSNLAFIKVEASNLPVISFENSDEYNPGEKIISIGNDMEEYQNSFNLGVLSGFDPTFNISGGSLSVAEKLEGVFLSDFNDKKISTGGPIINYSGQTIGITGSVQKNGETRYFQIPSNKIKLVLDKVINNKLDSNPIFGAYYKPITKSYKLINELMIDNGNIIYSESGQNGLAIIAKTPASQSNLMINDIVIKVNDEDITLNNSLSNILYNYKRGDIIKLMIIRNEEEKEIEIQL